MVVQNEGVTTGALDAGAVAEPWETGTFAEPLNYLFQHVRLQGRDGPPTNAEVAAATGNAESTIQQLRSGKKPNPTMKTIVALATFFQVSPGFFFDKRVARRDMEKHEAPTDAEKRLVAAMRSRGVRRIALRANGLSPESLKMLEAVISTARVADGLSPETVEDDLDLSE
ncbi:XRE family transcriptional regulator [Streptomyces ipomoeae]|uniref:Toxin-antitoxin system, antitoxin component, Xre family n=2 Tax=Streptomyces ipomoeae TaxID=103232 RepID=L1KXS4_9ACTN|nr:helix-turn-helix transcriptional regulator [Streptomyces ipomoeae]EKX65417.1 toxin-antitoxin system, antitoxin component, Xre family [Streptomyces ipomoeae 91-03]MDX2694420.1 helix-turn-helix transcriptional regulator [Streptomyces ipomoeae]MDX2837906.1 helix-turn-helix transcriptional regulator [Streptomyces ipomoeae]TQE37521.1 XRE family transcriptional regulator [Streptomyces ipomoeae]